MSFSFSDFAAALKAGARISAEDVLGLRRQVWPDGSISADEADQLFELNRLARESDPEWADFIIEAMTDHVLNAKAPRGYIDEDNAAWLISQVDRDGALVTATELELVVKLLEKALNAPASLKAWSLRQIEAGVIADGAIGEDEAKLLRRILFAAGGEGALTVSQDEAELLWRLKDACLSADNAPGWKTLFVQAVGNHLMAWSSYTPLERGAAARLEAFVDDHSSNVLGFLSRMRGANPAAEARRLLAEKAPSPDHDADVDAARAITQGEKNWLQSHVDADGARDPYEEALLAFVAEESSR
ncbi:MAG TPA: hypothetical protein VES64_04515 [Allosphingosinicella sp.]|nr:hypothetical protein [Allosphingosinicella sp.]